MNIGDVVTLQHLTGTIQAIKQTHCGMPFSGYHNRIALVCWDVAPNNPQWCDTTVLKINQSLS